jgi:hypothetical protein
MLSVIKIQMEAFNRAFIYEDEINGNAVQFFQHVIDCILLAEGLYNNNAGHYLTLSMFNESDELYRLAERKERQLESLISMLEKECRYITSELKY